MIRILCRVGIELFWALYNLNQFSYNQYCMRERLINNFEYGEQIIELGAEVGRRDRNKVVLFAGVTSTLTNLKKLLLLSFIKYDTNIFI